MRSVAELQAKVRRFYERHRGEWVEAIASEKLSACGICDNRGQDDDAPPIYDRPLQPPSEAQALADLQATMSWVKEWRGFKPEHAVQWVERRWPSAGLQRLPARLTLCGIEEIATVGGKAEEWMRLRARIDGFCAWVKAEGARGLSFEAETLPHTLSGIASELVTTSDQDWEIALLVLDWISSHPGVSCYIRELPIRGIDTKWIETHRKLVAPLARSLMGLEALPFLKPPTLVRFRWLDRSLADNGVTDFSCSARELAFLHPLPEAVIICENLVSMLGLPAFPKTAAIFGQGYGVESLREVLWLQDLPTLYWGDLDSHGFAILNRARDFLPELRSVLMDRETLRSFRDLCVREPSSRHEVLERLTDEEQATVAELFSLSPALRLEQERIPWDHALSCLREALIQLQP